jgi:hypothetical protein
MEQLIILQNMLDRAKKYNLEMECLVSLINNIADDKLDLAQECEHTLCEWGYLTQLINKER